MTCVETSPLKVEHVAKSVAIKSFLEVSYVQNCTGVERHVEPKYASEGLIFDEVF
jgi:hypothetical protein